MATGPTETNGYDIVGDVHGCAEALHNLLDLLGYKKKDTRYYHPQNHQLIFLGDLVDRGPAIRETLLLVRELEEAGLAQVILGNHEFNALTYCTEAPPGFYDNKQVQCEYLRPRIPRHDIQIEETLKQFDQHQSDWDDCLQWFRETPLFLEFEKFRVVHACWDQAKIDYIKAENPNHDLSNDQFFFDSADWSTQPGKVVDRILKGTDMKLPEGMTILGSDGVKRSRFRTMFWASNPKTYGDVVFQPDELPETVAATRLTETEKAALLTYPESEIPVFFGHYWCKGEPRVIKRNVACLDFSAVHAGYLVAYRMGNEKHLRNDHFIWVDALI